MGFEGKRILVTGGAGFIGSHLVDKLVELRAQVTVLDNLSFGKREYINPNAKFVDSDIRDYETLKKTIVGQELIYHLAAIATTKENALGWNNLIEDYEVNTIGTLNIFRALVEMKINPRVIYTSSAAVYGNPEYVPMDEKHPTNPISPYGVSKLTGEKYAHAYYKEQGLKITSLRVFNTYGPRQLRYVMFDLIQKLHKNPDRLEVMGTGQQIRDYCYVTDTVDAFILVAENDKTIGRQLNVAGGNPISIMELAEKIIGILGLNGRTNLSVTGKSWKGDIDKLIADISLIKQLVNFNPKVDIGQGLWLLTSSFR